MGESGGTTTVDAVIAGRIFPFSRAFARQGFSRAEAERWRRAGWHDPVEAARWRRATGDCTPRQLRALAQAGVQPDQVSRVAAFAAHHTAAWTRVLVSEPPDPTAEIDLRDPEARTRQAVRANLYRRVDRRLTSPRSFQHVD